MERLFRSESLAMYYDEDRDIFMGKWDNCNVAEKLIAGIKEYKGIFEKIVPEKVIWDLSSMSYTIPPELQNWILDFLDIPACRHGIDYKVAHILSPDIYASISVMNMYVDGKTTFRPHFFSHENTALDWVNLTTKGPVSDTEILPPLLKVESLLNENKGRITLDVDSAEVPEYLLDILKVIKNRRFFSAGIRNYMQLTAREKVILTLILQGKPNKIIADILSISCETVKTHRRNLLRKLQCKNMNELMRFQIFL
ncbi:MULTISPECIES: helix-turn-helix transcriptional regulator [Sphingobacterium]|uniref:helix-turn-helix transcriptional regulator n=1 Tax=Sphingobacterium TaxID=28453 RepID=UPI000B00F1B3|nr:helix-turn-helix transcriptional regulator [Sphingobacterium sp. Ag1]